MGTTRKLKDILRGTATYLSAALMVLTLGGLFGYMIAEGAPLFQWDLFVSDYQTQTDTIEGNNTLALSYSDPSMEGVSFSSGWGIGFKDGTDRTGSAVVEVAYLDSSSSLAKLSSSIQVGEYFTKAFLTDGSGEMIVSLAKEKAAGVCGDFDAGVGLTSISFTTKGGGIRGSFLSTLVVVALSLALSLPLGIGAAIYFAYFAPKQKKWVIFLERMIDITSGVPSIIYGLIGVAVFIPLVSFLSGKNTGSLLSGSLTMVIILLPGIVKTSQEALEEVPASYRTGALALGGSERQALYHVVLPTALPGLLSAGVLSAGRVIGESAALVYAIGTYISDSVSLTGRSATLAVEIWSLLAGENPNYALASAIGLLILLTVFVLSLIAKVLSHQFLKKAGAL